MQFSFRTGIEIHLVINIIMQNGKVQLKGRAREMDICMQQIGCFRVCTLHLLITFYIMVRFEKFLAWGSDQEYI